MAQNSVKIGIIMLIAWVIPLFGFFLAGIGLVLAIIAYASKKNAMARAGLFLNALGLALSALYVAAGISLLSSGLLEALTPAP
ncbi:MAG: hypothetical protein SVV67_04400 [Bacillota bacterium]|nr:hypothetical protein [Bacillota bacterium]